MEEARKYLLSIGFDDKHLPLLFNDDDKSHYTIAEIMHYYCLHLKTYAVDSKFLCGKESKHPLKRCKEQCTWCEGDK